MTRETLNKLPANVREIIENLRKEYKNAVGYNRKGAKRERLAGYVMGLRDAGLITERERQILFVYGTV